MVQIKYGRTEIAYDGYPEFLKEIVRANEFVSILDIGGGAHPMFSMEYIATEKLAYTVLDISQEELARTPDAYTKLQMDIASSEVSFARGYDFVFSRFMVEHVYDAEQMHLNVLNALRPGGMAVHFFPTLYALPFLVNWLLPNWAAALCLSKERRERGKFPAYYKWCVGPSNRSVRRLEKVGFEVIEYSGFFGHGYYDGVSFLRNVHGWFRKKLLLHPYPLFTSFAWVVLRKPMENDTGGLLLQN